jgi:hypothetical protein
MVPNFIFLVILILRNVILVPNFIFLCFQFIFGCKREKGSLNSGVDREFLLVTIPTTKTVYFCVKWFHIIRRVKIKCFITLEEPKNRYELGKIFGFKLIKGFGVVFDIFRGHKLV